MQCNANANASKQAAKQSKSQSKTANLCSVSLICCVHRQQFVYEEANFVARVIVWLQFARLTFGQPNTEGLALHFWDAVQCSAVQCNAKAFDD